MIAVFGAYYGFYFSEIFFPARFEPWIEQCMTVLKLSWLLAFPYALLNYYALLRYPALPPPPADTPAEPLPVRLYIRFVTRGRNPQLSAESLQSARRVLEAVLPADRWRIEVVSDTPLDISSADGQARLILVPEDFQTPLRTRYKARALQYALLASTAGDDDWIIHLDEETRFDANTLRHIWQYVLIEARRPLRERAIGQGVILYGAGQIVNWLTTLADSLRVGDDYGRFRFQFEHGKAWFGMHGSFIVINSGLERTIGFDHGFAGSITEDAYFALLAQAAGYRFRFVPGFMYEKSPFSIRDFILQRRRWFGGLWLCVQDRSIPLADRLILGTFMAMWSTSWLGLLMVYLNFIFPTATPIWLAMAGGISFAYYVLLYMVGFFHTFPGRMPWPVLLLRLLQQIVLIPIFSILESAGVIYGLIAPPRDFYIVQKEIGKLRRPTLPAIALPPGMRRRYQSVGRRLGYAGQSVRFWWLARRWGLQVHEYAGVYTAAFWQRAVYQRLSRRGGASEESSFIYCDLRGIEPMPTRSDRSLADKIALDIAALTALRVRRTDLVCRAGPTRIAIALFDCPPRRAHEIMSAIAADLEQTALSRVAALYGVQIDLHWQVTALAPEPAPTQDALSISQLLAVWELNTRDEPPA